MLFADKIYSELGDGDLFCSPLSVKVALGMCQAAAQGSTRKVISECLGSPQDEEDCNKYFKGLVSLANAKADGCEITMANALWGQQGIEYREKYMKVLASYFDGNLHLVDFARRDETCNMVNAWVGTKTHEKIPAIITPQFITEATRLILTNAIYFKALWLKELKRAMDAVFHGQAGDRPSQYIQGHGEFSYYPGDSYSVIDLKYKGGCSFMAVLPDDVDGLPTLEERWTQENLYETIREGLSLEEVSLVLPRFTLETSYSLKEPLIKAGMGLAFSPKADFSRICDAPLQISEVVHKARIEVDEKGTTAAAATAVGMMKCCVLSRVKEFRADHPFKFLIVDGKTCEVLFSGRLT